MKDSHWTVNALEKATHLAFSCLPAPTPTRAQLQCCKLIGHRGAHVGTPYIENTLDAFNALAEAGVWGAEMDIRWTKDRVPIISHDADCRRLFNCPLVIAETSFDQLRREVPRIPSLEEVIAGVGKRLHLMLEIKAEPYSDPIAQAAILQRLLSVLKPTVDYHFLALDPLLFSHTPFAPLASQIIVGTLNTPKASRWARETDYGGVAGAYPFFTEKVRRIHRQRGQKIGVGHIDSKRLLFREIGKDTDWIFSNRALQLQRIINTIKEEKP